MGGLAIEEQGGLLQRPGFCLELHTCGRCIHNHCGGQIQLTAAVLGNSLTSMDCGRGADLPQIICVMHVSLGGGKGSKMP